MKKFKNEVLTGYDGKSIALPMKDSNDRMEIRTEDAFWLLKNSYPYRTLEDSDQGQLLAQELIAQRNGAFIEVEESVWNWLKEIAKVASAPIFKDNGRVVYNYICEGYVKAEEKKTKAK